MTISPSASTEAISTTMIDRRGERLTAIRVALVEHERREAEGLEVLFVPATKEWLAVDFDYDGFSVEVCGSRAEAIAALSERIEEGDEDGWPFGPIRSLATNAQIDRWIEERR